jgi:hypothetical protein
VLGSVLAVALVLTSGGGGEQEGRRRVQNAANTFTVSHNCATLWVSTEGAYNGYLKRGDPAGRCPFCGTISTMTGLAPSTTYYFKLAGWKNGVPGDVLQYRTSDFSVVVSGTTM